MPPREQGASYAGSSGPAQSIHARFTPLQRQEAAYNQLYYRFRITRSWVEGEEVEKRGN